MVQEYLFIGDESQKVIEEYKPVGVTVEINSLENSDCWIAIYSVHGESKKSAELLSSVNDYVVKECHPTILTNGSSAYFNRVLFPYINEFERKLRKLLYLKSAISKGEKFSENIQDLESKDLGAIFELLFTDEKFVKEVKSQINSKSWKFTKSEILSSVKDISEETVWSHLIGEDAVPQLKQDFIAVKNYRNDVMHAHNIDAKTFRTIKKLFIKINKQLDTEIGKIIYVAETHPTVEESTYNADLNKAITERNRALLLQVLAQVPSPRALQMYDIALQAAAQLPPEVLKMQEQAQEAYNIYQKYIEDMQTTPEIFQRVQEQYDIYRKYIDGIQNGQT